MKLLGINIFAAFLVMFLAACSKDETKTVASPIAPVALNSSQTVVVLSRENTEAEAISFQWVPADFGYTAAITNILQIAPKGLDFVGATEVTLGVGTKEKSYTTLELNSMLLALELPVEQESELEIRIKSSIGPSVAPQYSNVVPLNATPYAAISYLYVPGAYQDWAIESAQSLVSPTSNGIYTGIIQFPEVGSPFKITFEKNWTNSYGELESGILVLNGGSDIKSPLAGNVEVTVNTNTLTVTYKIHTWGIIGDATPGGWAADTDMKYDNKTQTWSLTASLTSGSIKFRKNFDWGTNYGVTDGVFILNGGDIPVTESGMYNITLDTVNEKYTLVKQ